LSCPATNTQKLRGEDRRRENVTNNGSYFTKTGKEGTIKLKLFEY